MGHGGCLLVLTLRRKNRTLTRARKKLSLLFFMPCKRQFILIFGCTVPRSFSTMLNCSKCRISAMKMKKQKQHLALRKTYNLPQPISDLKATILEAWVVVRGSPSLC